MRCVLTMHYVDSVAMVSYSTVARVRFNFLASFVKADVKAALLNAVYQNAGTATGAGLDLARTDLLVASAGYRSNVKTVVVVITDRLC